MLKLLKGLDKPPTIINTDRIKFVQLKQIGLFINEGFAESYGSYASGIVLDVDYKDKYSSDKDVYIIGGHPVKIEVKICGE